MGFVVVQTNKQTKNLLCAKNDCFKKRILTSAVKVIPHRPTSDRLADMASRSSQGHVRLKASRAAGLDAHPDRWAAAFKAAREALLDSSSDEEEHIPRVVARVPREENLEAYARRASVKLERMRKGERGPTATPPSSGNAQLEAKTEAARREAIRRYGEALDSSSDEEEHIPRVAARVAREENLEAAYARRASMRLERMTKAERGPTATPPSSGNAQLEAEREAARREAIRRYDAARKEVTRYSVKEDLVERYGVRKEAAWQAAREVARHDVASGEAVVRQSEPNMASTIVKPGPLRVQRLARRNTAGDQTSLSSREEESIASLEHESSRRASKQPDEALVECHRSSTIDPFHSCSSMNIRQAQATAVVRMKECLSLAEVASVLKLAEDIHTRDQRAVLKFTDDKNLSQRGNWQTIYLHR